MDQKKLFKQMIDFQKASFDNSFNALAKIQEQGEKMVDMFLNQAGWLPEEGKKAVQEWMKAYKKGREDLKGTVEDNFKKVKDFFGSETQQ
jgi:polyhydroxyalkanoate synthesis regulator phasin